MTIYAMTSTLHPPQVDLNPDTGEPTDDLMPAAIDWCKAQGSESTKVSQILDNKDTVVLKAIQAGIDKANDRAVSRASKVQKWSLLPRDFSIPGGELGEIYPKQFGVGGVK